MTSEALTPEHHKTLCQKSSSDLITENNRSLSTELDRAKSLTGEIKSYR